MSNIANSEKSDKNLCHICTKSFELGYQLKAHIRSHERRALKRKNRLRCRRNKHALQNTINRLYSTEDPGGTSIEEKCIQENGKENFNDVLLERLDRNEDKCNSEVKDNQSFDKDDKEFLDEKAHFHDEKSEDRNEDNCHSEVKDNQGFDKDDKEFLDEKAHFHDEKSEDFVEEPINDDDGDFSLNLNDPLEIENSSEKPAKKSNLKLEWEGTFHDLVQSNEEPANCFSCPYCREIYAGRDTLNRHILSHNFGSVFKGSPNKNASSDDYPIYEGSTEDYFFNMPESEVEKLFGQKTDAFERFLEDLEDTTDDGEIDKNLQCPDCHRIFKKKMYLRIHLRTHTGERPYKCPHCSQAFKQRPHLTAHKRIHTEERPYKCSYCSESFKSKITLKRHIIQHVGKEHLPPTLTPKPPSESKKSLSESVVTLNHTKEKDPQKEDPAKGLSILKCPLCYEHFLSENYLQTHIGSVHMGKRCFKCPECQKEFKKHSHMIQHMKIDKCVF